MEVSFDTLFNIAGLFLSGSVGGFVTWKWQHRKMKAEAQTEEVNMAKAVQDTYQQMLKDKEEEVADKNRIITELREDRDHFRKDRNELRDRIEKTEVTVRNLQREVDQNARMVKGMRPFLCGVQSCPDRMLINIDLEKNKTQQ